MATLIIDGTIQHHAVINIGSTHLVIGRDASCQVPILDKGASRQHAEVFRVGELYFIRDLNSRNGIFVNERRVLEEMLRDGDKIQIGGTVLSFHSENARGGASDSEHLPDTQVGLKLEDLNDHSMLLDSNARRLQMLYSITRCIAHAEQMEQMTTDLSALLGDYFHAAVYLFLRKQTTNALTPLGSFLPENCAPGKISHTIIKEIMQVQKGFVIADALSDERFNSSESVVQKNINAVIGAPMLNHCGVVYVVGATPEKKFVDDDVDLLQVIADLIGAALANFRARDGSQNNLENLLTALTELFGSDETNHYAKKVIRFADTIAQQMLLPTKAQKELRIAAGLKMAEKALAAAAAPNAKNTARVLAKKLENYPNLENTLTSTIKNAKEKPPVEARILQLAEELADDRGANELALSELAMAKIARLSESYRDVTVVN